MNTKLLEKLAALADELDNNGSIKLADDVGSLIKELVKEIDERAKSEEEDIETNLTFCPSCGGSGEGIDTPWCKACKGNGFIALKEASIDKMAFIKKVKGKFCVVSKKGKSLGCYKKRSDALRRLRQVEFFKHNK